MSPNRNRFWKEIEPGKARILKAAANSVIRSERYADALSCGCVVQVLAACLVQVCWMSSAHAVALAILRVPLPFAFFLAFRRRSSLWRSLPTETTAPLASVCASIRMAGMSTLLSLTRACFFFNVYYFVRRVFPSLFLDAFPLPFSDTPPSHFCGRARPALFHAVGLLFFRLILSTSASQAAFLLAGGRM